MTNKEAHRLITVLLGITVSSETKLEHARNQTLKNAAEFVERYNEKLDDLSIDFCSANEKGHILKDQNGDRVFTKENQKALAKEIKKFLDSEVVTPFELVPTSDRKGLSELQIKYLVEAGFIRELTNVT